MIDFPQHEDVYGKWVEFASGIETAVLNAAGLPAAGIAVNLISLVVSLGQTQTQMLASIKKDTRLLREEPFKTARWNVGEARRIGPRDTRYARFVDDGLGSFGRALSVADAPRERAVVEFDLAVLYLATGHREDASYWLKQSCGSCRLAVDGLVNHRIVAWDPTSPRIRDNRRSARLDTAADTRAIATQIGDLGASVAVGGALGLSLVGLPAFYFWNQDRRRLERIRRALGAPRDVVSLSNLLEHLNVQANGGVLPPPLEIILSKPNDKAEEVWLCERSGYDAGRAATQVTVARVSRLLSTIRPGGK